jgi:precorrin-2/cobalt-factor-2 C20-methyltransferase
MSATVYLVGAGPGAADLLTLRAARLLGEADIVFHDALVPKAILELAPGAQKIAVGKRCGRHSTAQRFINKRLVDAAHKHRIVVRLKGGDPMLFGRAHEELAYLRSHGIAVEVVPGVTGMSGCWTRANVPMTWGNDTLAVLPGTLGEEQLVERLRRTDAAVIMKVGRNLGKVRRAVETAGLLSRAVYVERGTMQDERILPLADCSEPVGAYFATVLIPGEGRRL